MRTALLNDGQIVIIGSQYDALGIVRDNLSSDIADYLDNIILIAKEDEKSAIDELHDCSKIYKQVMKLNRELSKENNRLHYEITKLKDELYKQRKSTQ